MSFPSAFAVFCPQFTWIFASDEAVVPGESRGNTHAHTHIVTLRSRLNQGASSSKSSSHERSKAERKDERKLYYCYCVIKVRGGKDVVNVCVFVFDTMPPTKRNGGKYFYSSAKTATALIQPAASTSDIGASAARKPTGKSNTASRKPEQPEAPTQGAVRAKNLVVLPASDSSASKPVADANSSPRAAAILETNAMSSSEPVTQGRKRQRKKSRCLDPAADPQSVFPSDESHQSPHRSQSRNPAPAQEASSVAGGAPEYSHEHEDETLSLQLDHHQLQQRKPQKEKNSRLRQNRDTVPRHAEVATPQEQPRASAACGLLSDCDVDVPRHLYAPVSDLAVPRFFPGRLGATLLAATVQRVEGDSPLPLKRLPTEGQDLNVAPPNYLSFDPEHGVHRHAPGFQRNAQLATASLLGKAITEMNREGEECKINIVSNGETMRRVFQTAVSDAPLALEVHRFGAALVLDASAQLTAQPSTVAQARERALLAKLLYSLRADSDLPAPAAEGGGSMTASGNTSAVVGTGFDAVVAASSSSSTSNGIANANTAAAVLSSALRVSTRPPANGLPSAPPSTAAGSTTATATPTIATTSERSAAEGPAVSASSATVGGRGGSGGGGGNVIGGTREGVVDMVGYGNILRWGLDGLDVLIGVDTPLVHDPRTGQQMTIQLHDERSSLAVAPLAVGRGVDSAASGNGSSAALPASAGLLPPAAAVASIASVGPSSLPSSPTQPQITRQITTATASAVTAQQQPVDRVLTATSLSREEALDCWFDAMLTNVRNVALCVHRDGVVRDFRVVPSGDILAVVGRLEAAAALAFTSNVLQWLLDHCTKDNTKYLVLRNARSGALELFECPPQEVNFLFGDATVHHHEEWPQTWGAGVESKVSEVSPPRTGGGRGEEADDEARVESGGDGSTTHNNLGEATLNRMIGVMSLQMGDFLKQKGDHRKSLGFYHRALGLLLRGPDAAKDVAPVGEMLAQVQRLLEVFIDAQLGSAQPSEEQEQQHREEEQRRRPSVAGTANSSSHSLPHQLPQSQEKPQGIVAAAALTMEGVEWAERFCETAWEACCRRGRFAARGRSEPLDPAEHHLPPFAQFLRAAQCTGFPALAAASLPASALWLELIAPRHVLHRLFMHLARAALLTACRAVDAYESAVVNKRRQKAVAVRPGATAKRRGGREGVTVVQRSCFNMILTAMVRAVALLDRVLVTLAALSSAGPLFQLQPNVAASATLASPAAAISTGTPADAPTKRPAAEGSGVATAVRTSPSTALSLRVLTEDTAPLQTASRELLSDVLAALMSDAPQQSVPFVAQAAARARSASTEALLRVWGLPMESTPFLAAALPTSLLASLVELPTDAVGLSFKALQQLTMLPTTASPQAPPSATTTRWTLKRCRIYYYVAVAYLSADRFTKTLEALHRCRELLLAATREQPSRTPQHQQQQQQLPFASVMSMTLTRRPVGLALGTVNMRLAQIQPVTASTADTGGLPMTDEQDARWRAAIDAFREVCAPVVSDTAASLALDGTRSCLFVGVDEEARNGLAEAVFLYTCRLIDSLAASVVPSSLRGTDVFRHVADLLGECRRLVPPSPSKNVRLNIEHVRLITTVLRERFVIPQDTAISAEQRRTVWIQQGHTLVWQTLDQSESPRHRPKSVCAISAPPAATSDDDDDEDNGDDDYRDQEERTHDCHLANDTVVGAVCARSGSHWTALLTAPSSSPPATTPTGAARTKTTREGLPVGHAKQHMTTVVSRITAADFYLAVLTRHGAALPSVMKSVIPATTLSGVEWCVAQAIRALLPLLQQPPPQLLAGRFSNTTDDVLSLLRSIGLVALASSTQPLRTEVAARLSAFLTRLLAAGVGACGTEFAADAAAITGMLLI